MKRELSYAFKKTLPVFFGYLFLGIAFGLLLQHAGYGWPWALLISGLIYAGSLQFALVGFLTSGTGLFMTALMTLLINSRHIFYGLSFLERFRQMGRKYPYMIFSLTDETYSLLYAESLEEDTKPDWQKSDRMVFLIALLDHSYWVLGSVLGGIVGELITFDTTGIDFAMTALFLVIFLDQWQAKASRLPAMIGLFSATLFLILLGPDRFILPSLIVTTAILLLLRGRIRTGKEAAL